MGPLVLAPRDIPPSAGVTAQPRQASPVRNMIPGAGSAVIINTPRLGGSILTAAAGTPVAGGSICVMPGSAACVPAQAWAPATAAGTSLGDIASAVPGAVGCGGSVMVSPPKGNLAQ